MHSPSCVAHPSPITRARVFREYRAAYGVGASSPAATDPNAPSQGLVTGEPRYLLVVTPNDLDRYHAELSSAAGGLDAYIAKCPQLGDVTEWAALKHKIDLWSVERFLHDYVDVSAQWLVGQGYEDGVAVWQQKAQAECGYKPPPIPTNNLAVPPSLSSGLTSIEWIVGGVLAIVLLVTIGKVV